MQGKTFVHTFVVQSKTFAQIVWSEARLLFKHVGCKTRLLFKKFGYKKKSSNIFGAMQNICSNILGPAVQAMCYSIVKYLCCHARLVVQSKTCVQTFWAQSNKFVQTFCLELCKQCAVVYLKKMGAKQDFCSTIMVQSNTFFQMFVMQR